MSNFSYYRGDITTPKVPHFYCTQCSAHYHEDRWYTQDEWFFYINEETYTDYMKRMALENEAAEAEWMDLHGKDLT